MSRSRLYPLLVLAACTPPPVTEKVLGSPRQPPHAPAARSPVVSVAVRGGRLFGITSDGYTVFDDAGQLRALHVLGEKKLAIGMCKARPCNVEIRGRWAFIRNEGAVTAWTAEHGSHSLDGEGTVGLAGNDRLVVLSGRQARLLDRDWNERALPLPDRFEMVASYPESIVDPEGKNIFGAVDGRFVAVPLDSGSARTSYFGEVPRSGEAIRGKAGWRILLAFQRGAVALEKRAITFWNAADRTTKKLDDVDQRRLVAGLVAVAPDEKHVLYVSESGTKIASLDNAHRPNAIPGTPLPHREAFTGDSASVITLDSMTRTARTFDLTGGHEVVLGQHVHDVRPLGGSRVIVCDRTNERDTCDLAIVDAKTGVRTSIAAAVRMGELMDDVGQGRTFAVQGEHIAYLTPEPSALVVAPLPSEPTR